VPHITVGVVLDWEKPLPIRRKKTGTDTLSAATGEPLFLDRPINLKVDTVSVVHYAYRSLLRCVGEVRFPLTGPWDMSADEVAWRRSSHSSTRIMGNRG